MPPLSERVAQMIERESLIPPGGTVLVALSGGADSVALTRVLLKVAAVAGFTVTGVAHLNHQLREAADADEQFCRNLAEALSLPIVVSRADVRGRAERDGMSIEEAGHRERHAFFADAAATMRADRVATAHTRHDQAETFLMRLLRGAGPVGLSSIHPRSGLVVRPLLNVSRLELREYLAAHGQPFREDETNLDLGVTRNRIRHELIPLLEGRFSRRVVETLARNADIARHDARWLEETANAAASAVVTHDDDTVTLDRAALSDQPVALARRIVKQALETITTQAASLDQVERVLTLAISEQTDEVGCDLSGCRVRCRSSHLVIGPPQARPSVPHQGPGFVYPLPVPGHVEVPEAGLAISAHRVQGKGPRSGLRAAGRSVLVDGQRLSEPLIVRSWRPGDALRPLGLGGRKKIQDLFVDRKVDRSARQSVPIVADKKEGIVWVVGHTVAEDFRVTAGTEGMLLLKARKLGAS